MASRSPEIEIEGLEDGFASRIVLNRPGKKNALSQQMLSELRQALESVESGPARIVILCSAVSGAFCSGFDIEHLRSGEEAAGIELLYECFDAIEKSSKIFVCFADGSVHGGGVELFLSCDLRLATPRSVFRMTPVRLSQVYRADGVARVVNAVGATAAAEMFLTARAIPADEALRIGLVTRVVEGVDAVTSYVEDLAACAPDAQRGAKLLLRALAAKNGRPELSERDWARLNELRLSAHSGPHRKEALQAFAERRNPQFR